MARARPKLGVSGYKLPYIKQMNNTVLPHTTGDCIHCPVMTRNRKELNDLLYSRI